MQLHHRAPHLHTVRSFPLPVQLPMMMYNSNISIHTLSAEVAAAAGISGVDGGGVGSVEMRTMRLQPLAAPFSPGGGGGRHQPLPTSPASAAAIKPSLSSSHVGSLGGGLQQGGSGSSSVVLDVNISFTVVGTGGTAPGATSDSQRRQGEAGTGEDGINGGSLKRRAEEDWSLGGGDGEGGGPPAAKRSRFGAEAACVSAKTTTATASASTVAIGARTGGGSTVQYRFIYADGRKMAGQVSQPKYQYFCYNVRKTTASH